MRLIAAFAVVALLAAGLVFWWSGAFQLLAWQAAQQQHATQNALAAAIARVRAGDWTAMVSVLAACGAYGFFHAAGPGHGKAVIGGAALASRASAWRMSALAVAASLGQALTAVALVYGGFLLFEITARQATDAADKVLAPVSYLAIGTIGLFLVWRGLRDVWRLQSRTAPRGADAHAENHHHGAECDHRHGPSVADANAITSWRAALALVGGIAIRPCTGAIFVLVICWQIGLLALGILSVVAMAAGTAAFTVLVAVLAVTAREASLFSVQRSSAAQLAVPALQILAGGLIVALAAVLLRAGSTLPG